MRFSTLRSLLSAQQNHRPVAVSREALRQRMASASAPTHGVFQAKQKYDGRPGHVEQRLAKNVRLVLYSFLAELPHSDDKRCHLRVLCVRTRRRISSYCGVTQRRAPGGRCEIAAKRFKERTCSARDAAIFVLRRCTLIRKHIIVFNRYKQPLISVRLELSNAALPTRRA